MKYFVQVNKETKRVEGYSSSKSEMENFLEIEIQDSECEELMRSPMIFIYKDNNFVKDSELQDKLINEIILTDKQKIDSLTKQLAASKVVNIKQKSIINNLIKQRAEDKIDYMKSRNIIDVLTKQQAQNKIEIMKLKGGK